MQFTYSHVPRCFLRIRSVFISFLCAESARLFEGSGLQQAQGGIDERC